MYVRLCKTLIWNNVAGRMLVNFFMEMCNMVEY